jgi:hypothetical protein
MYRYERSDNIFTRTHNGGLATVENRKTKVRPFQFMLEDYLFKLGK